MANITPEHQRAIDLMAQAQATTNETQANALISQAMEAAQQSGKNNAVVFQAVHDHARQIQDRNVGLRPPSFAPSFPPSFSAGTASPNFVSSAPAPPPPPKPIVWSSTPQYAEPSGVKQADPDTVLFNQDSVSPELLLQLEYEDIGGIELINISREDIIDGQDVTYSPIKNLSSLRRRYNPNNIIALSDSSNSFFKGFGIDLVLRGPSVPYFDDNGDLVVEVEDLRDGELIDVDVDSSGTINEVDF
jgi:hypothetical protein